MSNEMRQLLLRLADADESQRRFAAEDLADWPEDAVITALAGALADDSAAVREAAAESLLRIGGQRVVAAAIPLLASETAAARNAACSLLVAIGEPAVDYLTSQLADDSKDVRLFAIDVLAAIGSALAERALTGALDDHDVNVAAAAAQALGEIRSATSVGPLVASLHANAWVRCAVARSLGKIGGPAAVEALASLACDADELVAFAAVQALAKAGDVSVLPVLAQRLGHANPLLVRAALDAIARVAWRGQPSAAVPNAALCESLETLARSHAGELADAAQEALRSISASLPAGVL